MELKPWQTEGASWLATRRHALLADEMRVGKTLTALEGARRVGAEWVSIVCPAVARFNWARNIQDHLGVTPQILLRRTDTPRSPYVVTSYELAASIAEAQWDLAILDEAHYLRRCDAGRTKRILGKGGLAHNAERVWLLSGTPAVNHYGELWQALYVFGLYPHSYEHFIREFCEGSWGPYGFQIRGSKNHERLREIMRDFMLRRKFADIAPQLPPIDVSDYAIELPRVAVGLDSPVLRAALEADDPMAALEAQAPAVATLRRYIGLAKVPQVADLARMALDGNTDKLVLFTYHREVLTDLVRHLHEFNPVSVAGGQSPLRRDHSVRAFKDDPKCRVFVGQIVAAGTNIDLSAANEAWMVESSWVPGENAQALMRLQNMNQTGPVTALFIGMADSLDGRIQSVARRKTRELGKLFG